MENKKREIAGFYKQIFSDIKLKERIVKKVKRIATEEDLKNLIQQEIVPLMKKYNVNFSEEELLEYEEETLKKLSKEDLGNISGGVSIKSALLTGGLLSMALLGGVSLNVSAMDNEPPSLPGEERRAQSSNNDSQQQNRNNDINTNNNNENDNDNANDNNNADNAQQNDIKNGVKSYLERAENQNLIDESRENDYEQAKNENRIAIGGGHVFSYTLDPSGQGIILTDIYTLVDGVLKIPSQGTIQDGRILNVTAVTPNLKLKELETRNLIDESRENDYEQAKNENRIAIGGGHIFSYTLASSGNGVILTDIYTKVVDGILVIPSEVTTQDGHVRPVVGIGGEKFRTSTFKILKLSPLIETFCFEGEAQSAFFGNKKIEIVDFSDAISLEYLEIGDSAFADSSLKSIVAPPQEVKIVTGKDAYGSSAHYEYGKFTKKQTLAPIAVYKEYSLHLAYSRPRFSLGGLFKTASMPKTIDRAKYTLNKLKSIINLSCLNENSIGELEDDLLLSDVVSAIENNELNSLEQSDRDLLLNAYRLLEKKDYDSQINVKPSKIGNNSNEPNDNDNNNYPDNVDLFAFATVAQDIINGSLNFNENDALHKSDDADNDNDNGGFNDHGGNNNDNDNDDDHNNNQGPEEFVASNGNSEASEQQSDNESQKIQAEATDNDDSDSQKISVDEFLAHGSLSLDNKDDAAFVMRFIAQNPIQTINDREAAQEIVARLGSFLGNDFGAELSPTQVKARNYGQTLISKFGASIVESDEKNDNFSDSDDNCNDNDNSRDSSKHDDSDNDDDDTPKKRQTKAKSDNQKISVDEFLARGSLSSNNEDDIAFIEKFIKQNTAKTITDRETAQKIVKIINNFLGKDLTVRNQFSYESMANNYMMTLNTIFDGIFDELKDESESDDNRNENDNISDSSKHDGSDNDDDDTPKKLKTKR